MFSYLFSNTLSLPLNLLYLQSYYSAWSTVGFSGISPELGLGYLLREDTVEVWAQTLPDQHFMPDEGDLLIKLGRWCKLVLGVFGVVAQHRGIEELGVSAVGAIPGMATVSPGQVESEGGEEVVERPGDDDVVVEANINGDEDHSIANTWAGQRMGSGQALSHQSSEQLLPAAAIDPPPLALITPCF